MREALENEFEYCLPALKKWYGEEMAAFKIEAPLSSSRPCIVFGAPVYGERYIDTFLDLCLPSMLAKENLPAVVKNWDILFILHTDAQSESRLLSSPQMRELKSLGVEIHVRIIPQEVFDACRGNSDKYWILGGANNLYIQFAKKLGAAHHMLVPDIVFSKRYFSKLFELTEKYDAIIQTNLSAKKNEIISEIEKFRIDGAIEIEAEELTGMALTHMHQRSADFLMNGMNIMDEMPACPCVNWIGDKKLYMYSPHFTLVYLSAKILSDAPVRVFNTADSQTPYFIPEGASLYAPQAHDDMSLVEISDSTAFSGFSRQKIQVFCATFWIITYFQKEYIRFFRSFCSFSLPKSWRNSNEAMPDQTIEAVMDGIADFLLENRNAVKIVTPKKFHIPFNRGNS